MIKHTYSTQPLFKEFVTPLLKNKRIIVVDGFEGVGKSHWISEILSNKKIPVLHVDDFVKRQSKVDLYVLKSRVGLLNQIKATNKPLIIEGILIRKILCNINVKPDLWIYVKKMCNFGWCEMSWLDKEYIRDYQPDISFYMEKPRYRQLFKYHINYEPQNNADLVVEINESLYI